MLRTVSGSRWSMLILLAFLKMTLELSYLLFVSHLFSYRGFGNEFVAVKYFESWLVVLLVAVIVPNRVDRPSDFFSCVVVSVGAIGDKPCACGLPYPVLKELKGRSTDALCINGKMIGSPVLTVLMSHTSVKRYQFHCYSDHVLLIVDADKDDFEKKDMNLIKYSFRSHVGDFEIRVSFDCSSFDKTTSGKHKVVVSHV